MCCAGQRWASYLVAVCARAARSADQTTRTIIQVWSSVLSRQNRTRMPYYLAVFIFALTRSGKFQVQKVNVLFPCFCDSPAPIISCFTGLMPISKSTWLNCNPGVEFHFLNPDFPLCWPPSTLCIKMNALQFHVVAIVWMNSDLNAFPPLLSWLSLVPWKEWSSVFSDHLPSKGWRSLCFWKTWCPWCDGTDGTVMTS